MESKFESFIDKIKNIKTLSKGLNNDNYLINDKYVWKNIKNKYLFDHKNEIEILKKLNYINLYYFDNDSICVNFLPGSNLISSDLKNNIQIITKKIKEYHNINFKTEKFWENIIPSWFDKISDINLRNKLNVIYQNLNTFEKDENDLVLCHHDIHGDNIIKNKNDLFFIDLEFSFTDYFFVDLGNLVCEMYTDYHNQNYNFENISINDKKLVLENYFDTKNISEDLIKKIDIGIKISHFYWALWGFILYEKTKNTSFDYKKFAESRLHFI